MEIKENTLPKLLRRMASEIPNVPLQQSLPLLRSEDPNQLIRALDMINQRIVALNGRIDK